MVHLQMEAVLAAQITLVEAVVLLHLQMGIVIPTPMDRIAPVLIVRVDKAALKKAKATTQLLQLLIRPSILLLHMQIRTQC